MEDGRLSDSQGRTVSFKDCLIVLTSNVGSQLIAKGRHAGLGFQLTPAAAGAEQDASAAGGDDGDVADGESAAMAHEDANLRALVHEEFRGVFRPEFLNRLDDIVVRLR